MLMICSSWKRPSGATARACVVMAGVLAASAAGGAGACAEEILGEPAAAGSRLPVPGALAQRLATAGLTAGDPVFIRIFKAESQLELWIRKGERFQLFAAYPICRWSGVLGPKLREGDRQSPEGFYTVTRRQLHTRGRWRRALDLGFPNAYDRSLLRTGSYVLVHGGCSSRGCIAMTNATMDEIYTLAESALNNGQHAIHVDVFPFRMTDAALALHGSSEWFAFWQNLKEGYDGFEAARRPPKVNACGGRYHVEPSGPEDAGGSPLTACAEPAAIAAEAEIPAARIKHSATGLLPLARVTESLPVVVKCSRGRASCRKWIAMQAGRAERIKVHALRGKGRKT